MRKHRRQRQDLQRTIQHVAADLHNDLDFTAMPPSAITAEADRDTF